MVPGKVDLGEKVVQVSAGDSHTAALTEEGAVYVWGSFRVSIAFYILQRIRIMLPVLVDLSFLLQDNNGVIGLLEPMKKCTLPVKVPIDKPVVKIVSGGS